MKRVSLAIVISLLAGALLVSEVQAKRLGGGSSIGRQSSGVTQRSAAPAPQSPSGATGAAPASPAAAPASPGAPAQAPAAAARPAPAATPVAAPAPARNRWLGPLAGIAAGIGLAALASHFGFGEELASFMLIGLLVFAVLIAVRLFMARRAMSRNPQPAWQGAGSGSLPAEPAAVDYGRRAEPVLAPLPSEPAASVPASAASGALPADFDAETFLKGARAQFTRLQAAFDAGDTSTLSEFTTADMARELRGQIESRGAQTSRTDVVRLEADVLGLESDAHEHMISVRFHGLIREEQDAPAQDFDEVWNLTKPVDGRSGWVLAGIQQMH